MIVYGVPIGTPQYRNVVSGDRQALWTALRLSIRQKFGYSMQHTLYSICEPVAKELDNHIWKLLEATTGFNITRVNEQEGLLINVLINNLDNKSFQEWALRLPSRLYGWGLRSLDDTCGAACIGTLETALPYMAVLGQVCPQLAQSWGGDDCWGQNAPKETRRRQVLDSGSSEGREITRVWALFIEL